MDASVLLIIAVLCILYYLWTRSRSQNTATSPNDTGLYENNNNKLTSVHEAMLAQRERLQSGYRQVASDYVEKQTSVEKEMEEKRKQNRTKTKSQRNEYTIPANYFPLTGSGGSSSYRPARKGKGIGG